ncbi:Citron Rho-Interacting Kinase [Manis pentadactyla]|nr:Citron Rho-Interacting Kinase [Manis pentadactyla]
MRPGPPAPLGHPPGDTNLSAPPPPGPGRRRDRGARRERPDCAARPEERRGRRGSPSAGLAQQLPPSGRVTSAPASGARRGGARSPSTMRPLSARGAPPSG